MVTSRLNWRTCIVSTWRTMAWMVFLSAFYKSMKMVHRKSGRRHLYRHVISGIYIFLFIFYLFVLDVPFILLPTTFFITAYFRSLTSSYCAFSLRYYFVRMPFCLLVLYFFYSSSASFSSSAYNPDATYMACSFAAFCTSFHLYHIQWSNLDLSDNIPPHGLWWRKGRYGRPEWCYPVVRWI